MHLLPGTARPVNPVVQSWSSSVLANEPSSWLVGRAGPMAGTDYPEIISFYESFNHDFLYSCKYYFQNVTIGWLPLSYYSIKNSKTKSLKMNSSDQSLPRFFLSVRHALIWSIKDPVPNLGNTYVSLYHTKTNKIFLFRAKMCENYKVSWNLIYLKIWVLGSTWSPTPKMDPK